MEQPPIKKGYLYRPQKGIKKYWVKRWSLLYPATETLCPRLETFDNKEAMAKDGAKPTVLSLPPSFQAVQSTQHRSRDFVLEISIDDKTIAYAVDTREELETWLQVFGEVAGGHSGGHSGKRTSIVPDLSSIGAESFEGVQENTLYDSYETMTFNIAIKPTAFSDSLILQGNYCLQIDSVKLSLLDENTSKLLYAWPYRYLRRYGRDKTSFSMEAGRKCESGPGLIIFETKDGNDIFHNIQNFVNNISGRQYTPPTQSHTAKEGHHQLAHDSNRKAASPGKLAVNPPPVAARSHTMDPIVDAITESSVFRQKVAERKDAMEYAEEAAGIEHNRRRPKPYKVREKKETQPPPSLPEAEPDPVYSEVKEDTTALAIESSLPMPEGDYFLPEEDSNLYLRPPTDLPEFSDYDVLDSTALYDMTTQEQQGDRWKDFGRTEDNIHTENYVKGLVILEDEGASSDPEPVKPIVRPTPVKVKPPSKPVPLPKTRATIRNKMTKTPDAKKDPASDDSNAKTYDTVQSLSVPGTTTMQNAANGQDTYDHFVRPSMSHPVPAPRKSNSGQPSQVDDQSEVYDHLQRETNTGGPRMTPKPYLPKQRSLDPEDAYDVLVPDGKTAASSGSLTNLGVGTLPEESQYSEATGILIPEQPVAENEMDENPYDVVAYQ